MKDNKKKVDRKQPLQLKVDGTEYGIITKMLGAGRVEAKCFKDNVVRNCAICGRMKKKVWLNVGDIVLVSLRDFQDNKADIVHKYAVDEARQLKQMGEIPSSVRVNEVVSVQEDTEQNDNSEDVNDDFDFDAI
jgi:translation initiation factor 1A